jgi:hypothetical protein
VYQCQGRLDAARQAFETSLVQWQELAQPPPSPAWGSEAILVGFDVAHLLLKAGNSEEAIQNQFERLRDRPDVLGGPSQYALFLKLLRVKLLALREERSGQPISRLAAARAVSAMLDCYHHPAFPDGDGRLWVAVASTQLSLHLRRGGAVAEALGLAERGNGTLQELVREGLEDAYLFAKLSDSWNQISRAHWELDQVEETLDACRRALAAQRQACTLAPIEAVTEYRRTLGQRCLQLGRKLCEVGRLDDAEACFREREALWPGDAGKRAEALGELRKWAAQVGKDGKNLSPEEEQERRRYLDLCARLESKEAGVAPATGNGKP